MVRAPVQVNRVVIVLLDVFDQEEVVDHAIFNTQVLQRRVVVFIIADVFFGDDGENLVPIFGGHECSQTRNNDQEL